MIRAAWPLIWLILPALVAGLVVVDAWMIRDAPAGLARLLHLRELPYATPLIVALAIMGVTVALRLAQMAGGFATGFMALVLMALQVNGIGAGPLDIFDVALFGGLAAWIARCALDEMRPVRLSLLFWLATGLVVLTVAHLPVMAAVPWFIGLFGIIRAVVIALLIVDLCRDLRMIDVALRIFVVVAVVSAALGVVQFALAYMQIFVFTLIDPPLSAFKPTPIGFVMRASGLCITAQHFSSFLVYALPVALWRLSEMWRLRDAAGVVVILAGIAVSLNFGAMFAALLVMGLMPFLRWPRLAIHLGLGLLGAVSLAYFAGLLDLIYDLSFGDAGIAKGVDQRKTLFTLGLEQFGRSPLVGTGVRGFGDVDGNFWDRPVHNLFGQAAVELGLGGVLIMLGIFFALTLDLARLGGKHAYIALLMLEAALQLGLSEPNLDQSNLWIVLALAQAVIVILRAGDVKESPPPTP